MRSYNTRKRILVTGGAVFWSRTLCERLSSDDHDVLCVDKFFTVGKRNIEHLGAINLLGRAKRTRVKILQAGTSEVCGDPEVHPQPESY